jgi:hypothetical protein
MPGAAPELPAHAPGQQPLTAEQFRLWKQQQDAQAAQACLCTLLRMSCSQAPSRHEDQVLTICATQAKATEAQQRREDILAGRVLPNGAPRACCKARQGRQGTPVSQFARVHAGRELYELHPELFEDY